MAKRSRGVVYQTLKRDGRECQKCGETRSLHVHHMKELWDGGLDTPENCVTLCAMCHHEWDAINIASTYPFERWLKHQPVRFILYNIDSAIACDMPLSVEWLKWL